MRRPLAVVYRGKAAQPTECSDALAELLASSPPAFVVQYVGPKERLPLNDAVLRRADLYAQPGGGDVGPAYRLMRPHRTMLRRFVSAGGRYLGVCLGGYLAGASPGFGLLPGDTEQYIRTRGATVRSKADTIVSIRWRGRTRYTYFQDGPCFRLDRNAKNVVVLARYGNGEIAAAVTHFKGGRVGVVGVHPEADESWYKDAGLRDPDGLDHDLGYYLIAELMR